MRASQLAARALVRLAAFIACLPVIACVQLGLEAARHDGDARNLRRSLGERRWNLGFGICDHFEMILVKLRYVCTEPVDKNLRANRTGGYNKTLNNFCYYRRYELEFSYLLRINK